jgi:hypothetical protein
MTVDHTSIESFTQYYRETFVPAYSDVTSYLLAKPESILLGIENTFSHIAQFLDSSKDESIGKDNLKKAYHHLERATLDCYKILWVRMQNDLQEILIDQEMRKFCVNTSESDFLKKYDEFIKRIRDARIYELNNVGADISTTVDHYKRAIECGNSLCSLVDHIKIQDYKETRKKWLKKITIKDVLVGVVGAIIGAILWEVANYTGLISSFLLFVNPK